MAKPSCDGRVFQRRGVDAAVCGYNTAHPESKFCREKPSYTDNLITDIPNRRFSSINDGQRLIRRQGGEKIIKIAEKTKKGTVFLLNPPYVHKVVEGTLQEQGFHAVYEIEIELNGKFDKSSIDPIIFRRRIRSWIKLGAKLSAGRKGKSDSTDVFGIEWII